MPRRRAIAGALEWIASICSIVLVAHAATLHAQNARTVLIEEFTGAWCGYCPDGGITTEKIVQRFGARVVSVALHNRDAMEIPEEGVLAPNAPGYPSLMIDRHRFSGYGSLGINDRSAWEARVEERLAVASPASVEVDALYDEISRRLSVTVRATFSEEITGELRFNAYVVEDSVVGYGRGYDQSNYFDQEPEHPMYRKGNPAVGYVHRHVVRTMLGGAWGSEGSVPPTVAAGETYTLTYEVAIPRAWNDQHISVVGLMQRYATGVSQREIVNTAERKLFNASPTTHLALLDDAVAVRSAASPMTSRFVVKNLSGQALTYNAMAATTKRTPRDWGVTLATPSTFTLAPGEADTCVLTLEPGATAGIGDARLLVRVIDGSDRRVYNDSATLVAAAIERLHVMGVDDPARSIGSLVEGYTGPSYAHLTERQWNVVMPSLESLDRIVWSGGGKGGLSAATADYLERFIRRGGGLLVTGQVALPLLSVERPDHPLFTLLGVGYDGKSLNANGLFTLETDPGNPVIDGWLAQGRLPAGSFPLPELVVRDGAIAGPMLRLGGSDGIIGTTSESSGSRGVVIGIDPMVITDSTKRSRLIHESLRWLDAPSDVEAREYSVGSMTVAVAPNPFIERTSVRLEAGGGVGPVRLVLHDLLGREVEIIACDLSASGNRSIEIGGSHLPSGIYRLTVISGEGCTMVPILKQ